MLRMTDEIVDKEEEEEEGLAQQNLKDSLTMVTFLVDKKKDWL